METTRDSYNLCPGPTTCPVHEKLFEIVIDMRAKQDITLEHLDDMKDILIRVVKIEERNQFLVNKSEAHGESISDLSEKVSSLENDSLVAKKFLERRIFLITILAGFMSSLISIIPWILQH